MINAETVNESVAATVSMNVAAVAGAPTTATELGRVSPAAPKPLCTPAAKAAARAALAPGASVARHAASKAASLWACSSVAIPTMAVESAPDELIETLTDWTDAVVSVGQLSSSALSTVWLNLALAAALGAARRK